MIPDSQRAEYAEMAAAMLGTVPGEVPTDIMERIARIHELYQRHAARMDLDMRTLLVAIVTEESGLIPWPRSRMWGESMN